MSEILRQSFIKLKEYCEFEQFKGWDPYDGLNSSFFRRFFPKTRLTRLAWIQAFKRSPVNLRRVLGVRKDYNPKALGLFLSGYCMLYRMEQKAEYLEQIRFFTEQLTRLQTSGWSGACWGYNFDWQARAFFQPKYTPTVVASTFIANAFLDAYELTKDTALLNTARSTCDFVMKDLNRTPDDEGNFAFSYSPLDNSVVFNASLLGSRLLARVYHFTREDKLISIARKSVAFCCKHQNENGSWPYGTYSFHQWIDNFHTGYNLECIADYLKYSGDSAFQSELQLGCSYYLSTFFTDAGVPKYYNNATYPVDIHAPAQLVITLTKTNKFDEHRELLERVLCWTVANMQAKQGYFIYQRNRNYSSRIPYMRWAQAWMFYSLTTYLYNIRNDEANKDL